MRPTHLPGRHLLVALVTLVALVALVLPACGSGGGAGPDAFVRRHLPDAVLARKAIAYSGYRAGQSPELQSYPSEAEIAQDLDLLVRGGWGFIRLFDSSTHAERVLAVIAANGVDLKVMLGVWISGNVAEHDAANRLQIDKAVALVAQYPDVIAAVSVGNETLDSWSSVRLPPAELAAYIAEVRRRVSVPVTTDDSWLPFMLGRDGDFDYADVIVVAQAVDFLSLHVYAFADAFWGSWNWKQASVPESQRAMAMMAAAVDYTKASIRDTRALLLSRGVDVPILIGEWGWKSATGWGPNDPPEDAIERHFAHPYNQKVFFTAIMDWVYGAAKDADSPLAAFYFEGFDEPWKGAWGDDGWGLFDTNRVPKFVVQDVYPDLAPPNAPVFTEADAVYYREEPAPTGP